jgi:type II secretory pathway pseudopilin PulG
MSLRNEQGYSLIESIVAMTLFLSVLVPISSAWVYFMKTQDIRMQSTAIDAAVHAMERQIHEQGNQIEGRIESTHPSGLHVVTEIRFELELAKIDVYVLSRASTDTLYRLYTERRRE